MISPSIGRIRGLVPPRNGSAIASSGLNSRLTLLSSRIQKRFNLFGALAAFSLVFPLPVHALVTEPNGLVVPLDSANGEVQLYTFFADQGETIDWQTDAHETPDTFSPVCNFTATLMLRETRARLGVGWYNVVNGATVPPNATQIHQIVPPDSAVGMLIASADIRKDPNYLGGDIGFALIRTPPQFSESKWNTVCNQSSCSVTGPWILGVTYKSTKTPNAWYLAFEDGDTSNASWYNDGDFNDYVFLFTGIVCAGAGQPCTPEGALGICSAGLTECDSAGKLVCKQLISPTNESCDGVDNNCNGETDDGEGLCKVGELCVRGTCVPYCGVEFPCYDPTVCEGRVCVHPDCVGVTCDKGQACIEGKCRAPCDGVRCPPPLTCRVGRCVDPCEAVQCGDNLVCQNGVCLSACACQSCDDGLSCRQSDGLCVESGCLQVSCNKGQYCANGQCVDACLNAACPAGQACELGACIDREKSTSAGDGGQSTGNDRGLTAADASAFVDAATKSGGNAGTSSSTDAGRPFSGTGQPTYQPGCGCRTLSAPTGSPDITSVWLLGSVFALFLRRLGRR